MSIILWGMLIFSILAVIFADRDKGAAVILFLGCVFFLSPAQAATNQAGSLDQLENSVFLHVPQLDACYSNASILATMAHYNLEYQGIMPVIVNGNEVALFASANGKEKVFIRATSIGGCYLVFLDFEPTQRD